MFCHDVNIPLTSLRFRCNDYPDSKVHGAICPPGSCRPKMGPMLAPWSLLSGYPNLALQWHHNECDGVTNHQPHDCLLNRWFRRRSKKISKLCVTGLCKGNSPMTGEFPAQRASNAENISIWWRHHDISPLTLLSQEANTQYILLNMYMVLLCFALLRLRHQFLTDSCAFYPYHSELIYWNWGNHMYDSLCARGLTLEDISKTMDNLITTKLEPC